METKDGPVTFNELVYGTDIIKRIKWGNIFISGPLIKEEYNSICKYIGGDKYLEYSHYLENKINEEKIKNTERYINNPNVGLENELYNELFNADI